MSAVSYTHLDVYKRQTRARERLLLFASMGDVTRGLWFAPQGAARVWQGQSMLDWIMCALMDQEELREAYLAQLTGQERRRLGVSTVPTLSLIHI